MSIDDLVFEEEEFDGLWALMILGLIMQPKESVINIYVGSEE